MSKQPSKDLTDINKVNKKSEDYLVGYLNGFCDGELKGKSIGYDIGKKAGFEMARRRFKELNPNYAARRLKK